MFVSEHEGSRPAPHLRKPQSWCHCPWHSPISAFGEITLGWKEIHIKLLRNRALSSTRTILMIMKVDHERKILVDHERKIFIEKKFFKMSAISPNNDNRDGAVYLFSVWGSFSGGDLVSCDNPVYWEWCVGRLTLRLGRDPVLQPPKDDDCGQASSSTTRCPWKSSAKCS